MINRIVVVLFMKRKEKNNENVGISFIHIIHWCPVFKKPNLAVLILFFDIIKSHGYQINVKEKTKRETKVSINTSKLNSQKNDHLGKKARDVLELKIFTNVQ